MRRFFFISRFFQRLRMWNWVKDFEYGCLRGNDEKFSWFEDIFVEFNLKIGTNINLKDKPKPAKKTHLKFQI